MSSLFQFQKLFEPVSIGKLTLKNRIFMAPMGDRYAADGYVTDRQKAYYETRAGGGAGLIIVGWAYVDFRLGRWRGGPQIGIDDDKFIPGLTELAGAIKKQGAKAAIQIGHVGGRSQADDGPLLAPSAIAHLTYKPPRALSINEIGNLRNLFINAGRRAQRAGFDGIELHAAHGFLLGEFLSSAWNKRNDEYGGSLENRVRFLVEIIKSLKAVLGRDYPVWYRYNCEEPGLPDGVTLAEAQGIAKILEDAGADALNVSKNPTVARGIPPFTPAGFALPLAQGLKKSVRIPVLVAGWITSQMAEDAIKEGKADLIGFGRALIADPELPNKLVSGETESVRPCLRCQRCFGERKTWDVFTVQGGIQCSVNPVAGREQDFRIMPSQRPKKVLIVGGGPGGMEAAIMAAQRGHQVHLYEKSEKLGGQLRIAAVPPLKDTIQNLIKYLETQVKKSNIEVKVGEKVTPELVARIHPDVVIIAAGGRPSVPKITGINAYNAFTVEEVLAGRPVKGKKVVIIGGGEAGLETAEFLAEQGKQVSIMEMLEAVGGNMNWQLKQALLVRLDEKNVAIHTGVRCNTLTDGILAFTTQGGDQRTIQVDTLVLAAGVKPNRELYETITGKFPEIYLVGDCLEPRGILEAIHEGAEAGRTV